MAIFKPEKTSSGGNFTGVCEFGILEFTDKSGVFDWADIFLEVTVKQKDSDYNRVLQIKGSLEKENGKITGGSVLKRMYHFFEQIGCGAGINVDGGWEDEKGDEIKDIAKYLNKNFLPSNGTYEPNMDYLGYFYKEQPKTPGGTAYVRVFTKVYRNQEENKSKLKSDVDWMKSKGYLKEVTDVVTEKTEMSGSGLANL
jgi:hypothetical protein